MPPKATFRFLVPVLILSVVASACGAQDDDITLTFEPCEPLVLEPAANASLEERQSIEDAAEMWNLYGTRISLADAEEEEEAETIPIEFEDAAPMFFGVYRDEMGDVVINDNIDGRYKRAIVVAHELGHAFGLEHVEHNERPSVMVPGNADVGPTDSDANVLQQMWPNCELDQ